MVTIPLVEASRPEELVSAAAKAGAAAATLQAQIARQQSTLTTLRTSWQGTAADAALAKAAPTLQQLPLLHQSLIDLQTSLHTDGTALIGHRTALLETVSQLTALGWSVAPHGTVSVQAGSALDQYARISPANAMRVQQLAATHTVVVARLLGEFDAADRRARGGITAAVAPLDGNVALVWSAFGPKPQTPARDGPQIPETTDPVQIRDWWTSLTDEERERLLREHPEKLGNLNGIRVSDRSEANKTVMNNDIDRVQNRAAVLGADIEEVLADPQRYNLTDTDVTRYRNAVKVREGLQRQAELTDEPTYLFVYEPEEFGGQGRAAVAVGNPDTAEDTVVLVPGTGNSVTDGWLASDDITNVFKETNLANDGGPTAVVAWMGYDAPDSPIDPRIAMTGLAREGGQLLASDVNALDVTSLGTSHVTTIGHSYGSTTVADAAAGYGMRVDDVVLIGSPGTDMAKSAADFHLPEGGHVYVGSASTDPITGIGEAFGALGNDPSMDGYGSTRFKAEVYGFNANVFADHSAYFEPGSESLYSIGDIASGNGDKLQEHGMTAQHRGAGVLPDFVDPELFRRATTGHHH